MDSPVHSGEACGAEFKWLRGIAVIALLIATGCVSDRPVAPLVPLPDNQMPTQEDLSYRPWRVVVAEVWGYHRSLEEAFAAELKSQLTRYGIQNVSSDAKVNDVMQGILQTQLRGGGDVSARDVTYEVSSADGILSVQVTTMTVKKNNELYTWKDKKGKINYRYTSEVYVAGHCTMTPTRTGTTRTIQFGNSQSQISYGQPHQFSVEALGLSAVRQAGRSSNVMEPIYTQFPLTGYVIGTGDSQRLVKINRGSRHGVERGRIWDFLMVATERNILVGELVTEEPVGDGKTMEVYPEMCVVKCDSSRTRERVKLGMKTKARGFGFIWPW